MQGYNTKVFRIMRTHILPGDQFAERLNEMKVKVVSFTLGRVKDSTQERGKVRADNSALRQQTDQVRA
jgi:hypothetical protein